MNISKLNAITKAWISLIRKWVHNLTLTFTSTFKYICLQCLMWHGEKTTSPAFVSISHVVSQNFYTCKKKSWKIMSNIFWPSAFWWNLVTLAWSTSLITPAKKSWPNSFWLMSTEKFNQSKSSENIFSRKFPVQIFILTFCGFHCFSTTLGSVSFESHHFITVSV